jgi:dienelactone hydrolase
MRFVRRAGAAALAIALLGAAAAAQANDYSDDAYREHDAENMARSSARQRGMATSPDYMLAFMKSGGRTWWDATGNQLADLNTGRVHAGLGQILPGGAVGDPQAYDEMTPRRIQFLSRTGAKLSGRIWGSEAPGPRPGIVITTGSIQGTEHMYWWAARTLARAGYVVMTWDVQGQGESGSTGHAFGDITPTMTGVPSQQNANFYEGTIDALRFFYSTPAAEYRPVGITEEQAAAAKETADANSEHLDWVNPAYGVLDRDRLGIAGHSLGAGAVSAVQQCSDKAELWKTVPLCAGQSFPIDAVVGWDSLGSGVTPVVPGMNQQADGYFLNPTPAYSAPDAGSHLAAHDKWVGAGLDTFSLTIRGGTHIEWTEIPWILPATAYGTQLADYYTLAWFDRYVMGDTGATQRLVDGPHALSDPDTPWNAHHLSTRYLSAFSLTGVGEVVDLRADAGLSEVGDWAGSNADRVGRETP